MSKSKSTKSTKPKNLFKSAGLRHPSNLPQGVQWQVEGDAELMKKLSPEEQLWLAAFDEAEFGGNPGALPSNGVCEKRKAWNRKDANGRDLMTLGKGNDRVSLEKMEFLNKREPSLWPSKAELREKVSIDAVQRDTATNSVEDAMIALLDYADTEVPRQKMKKVIRLKVAVPKPPTQSPVKRRLKTAA